jgi:elongation factor 2
MVNFTIDQLRENMNNTKNIRNLSVIAHVDHGKSTLTDSLVAAAGIIAMSQAGDARVMDTRKDEQDRTITIKSTGISLHFRIAEKVELAEQDAQGREFLINLIDSPGHVDFSSEVTAALRVTDGALVVVDCVEGVCVQTQTVLRQALAERIVPVVTINKLDRGFLELQLDSEEMYQSFCRSLEDVNVIISTYSSEEIGDIHVSPERGNVAFSAGLQGWAFTLRSFARIYAKRFGVSEQKMISRLWGDNYYDSESKSWLTSSVSPSGKPLRRAFCEFCLDPIGRIFKAATLRKSEALNKMLDTLGIVLSNEERALESSKALIKAIMQKFLPAGDALLEMIVQHLPSPQRAQKYRCELLYQGPLDDETATAIRNCDPNGPLCIYISKMVPNTDRTRFFAFGRVFSGTVSGGQKVRIYGPSYAFGQKQDLYLKSIQRTVLMMGKKIEAVESVPCGNTVGLVGVDEFISKTATIVERDDSHPLKDMKYSVSPVVRVAVEPVNANELPKLIEGLRRLQKADSLVQCFTTEAGQHIVAGAGELHLEICLKDLQEDFMNGAEIRISEPVVTFRETVSSESNIECLSKSANKLNRLMAKASPVDAELAGAIEKGTFNPNIDAKQRTKELASNFNFDASDARRIWCFGPNLEGNNIVQDATVGSQYMAEAKDSIIGGFNMIAREGALAEEPLYGVHFKIYDAVLHRDNAHRGSGQLIPCARRVFCASQLSAEPRLMEPIFLVEIQAPKTVIGGIYSTLNKRQGRVIEEIARDGTPMITIKAHLPVRESFGFTEDLRAQTSGNAFPQCVFDHWAPVPGNPVESGSKAREILAQIRKRKGLPADVPLVSYYHDKL